MNRSTYGSGARLRWRRGSGAVAEDDGSGAWRGRTARTTARTSWRRRCFQVHDASERRGRQRDVVEAIVYVAHGEDDGAGAQIR